MTEAELIELFIDAAQTMDSNFQFWLSITFALLVASHLAKGTISRPLQVVALSLYLAASTLFFMRHNVIGGALESLRVEIQTLDSNILLLTGSENQTIGYLYWVIFLGGTLATVVYVIVSNLRLERDT